MDAAVIEKMQKAGIDYVGGVDRFGGNNEMFEKFLRRFPADPHFAELETHLEAQDIDQAFRCAHTLKGVVGNLSFTEYFEAVSCLSALLHERKLEEACITMALVRSAHTKVIDVLQDL
jgi:HPt (histidine-containing phosphotransfer) domain-containing protein